MNEINLRGVIKDIQPSHTIDDISFYKAKMICKRENGIEDVINLRFKEFSNKYKDNDEITLSGNVRSYSYKTDDDKNKVTIYVFTYFDVPEEMPDVNNFAVVDGRICKINDIRTTKNGKHNIHFILANNLTSGDNSKRLNSYIPCIVWGKLAKEISNFDVNTKLKLFGELHSREHKKVHDDGNVEIRVAHEFLVTGYEVIE